MTNHLYEEIGAEDRRERIGCTKETKRGMGVNGAFVRRNRSGGWVVTDRLYEECGAEDGRCRIVCMVRSEKTL